MQRSTFIAFTALLLAGCEAGSGPTPLSPDLSSAYAGPASSISVFSGNAQQAPAGTALPNAIGVRVLDSAGVAVQGAVLQWQVTAGGGTLSNVQTVTDASGLGSANWTLGPRVGAVHTVQVRVNGVSTPATFTATGTLPATATLHKISGGGQTARGGTTLADSIVLEVRLADGRKLQGVQVVWTTPDGGRASPDSTVTGADGRARTSWTLGTDLATQRITATTANGFVRFEATATPHTLVALTPSSLTLETGQSDTLRLAVDGADSAQAAYWIVADSSVAIVYPQLRNDRLGLVLARKPGTIRIIAGVGAARDTMMLTVVPLPDRFVTFDTGDETACALTGPGRLYCWGNAVYGSRAPKVQAWTAPTRVAESRVFDWVSLGDLSNASGRQALCAGTDNGPAYCWGGPNVMTPSLTPRLLPGGESWRMIEVGEVHACGITASGAARCFGDNRQGALGNGSTASTSTPVLVSGGREWMDITAGAGHSCGLTAGGAAFCWGKPNTLGIKSRAGSLVPVAVEGGHTFTMIDAGEGTTCALDQGGTAWCWGPYFGAVPAAVPGVTFTDIEVSPSDSEAETSRICGVGTDGKTYCWFPQPGATGPGAAISTTPTFTHVEPFYRSRCGITADNVVFCWGTNTFGQLGTADRVNRAAPTRVVGQP